VGRREPNTASAWVIIAIGIGLVAVAIFQVMYLDATFNMWFLALLVIGLVAYGAMSFTSSVEMVVELVDEELRFTKTERALGKSIRDTTLMVERDRISKVVERNAGLGIRVVKIEDADRRKLLVFPEFLDVKEHDEMIAAIIEWGNQPSEASSIPSSSSSSEDGLLATSK
jgi:hypothetical protein